MIGLKEVGRFCLVPKDLKLKGSFEVNNRTKKTWTGFVFTRLQAFAATLETAYCNHS